MKLDLRCTELGHVCSKPVLECDYDRVVDRDGKLFRVQVKYMDSDTSNSENSVTLRLTRISHDWRKAKTYSKGEIDAVVGYIPRIDKLIWLDIEKCEGKQLISIRTAPSKNGQTKGCWMADDYVF